MNNKPKKNWERELEGIYRSAVINKSHNLKDLYIKLERAAEKAINKREMPEGKEFIIPLGITSTLKMKFFAPFSEVYLLNKTNNEWEQILKKENTADFEYNNVLDFYDDILRTNGHTIGEAFPENLRDKLIEVKVGDLLNFEYGNTYLCTKNGTNGIHLKKIKDKDDNLSLKSFKDSEEFKLDLKDDTLQKFYVDNRSRSGRLNLGQISVENTAQEYINSIYSNLKPHATKTIDFGPIRLHVKKSSFSNELKWYNNHGDRVDEKKVKMMIGYFNSKGVEREYNRKENTPFTIADDIENERQIEDCINNREFSKAYNLLKRYVENNKKSLTVTNKGYELNGDNFTATGYSFIYKDNEVKLYKLSYQNNDITKINKIEKEASRDDFINFYTSLYNRHRFELFKSNEEYINDKYKGMSPKLKRPILNDLSNKEIAVSDSGERKISLTEHKDIKISYTDEEIDNLIESFDYDEKEYDDINNYDFDPGDD